MYAFIKYLIYFAFAEGWLISPFHRHGSLERMVPNTRGSVRFMAVESCNGDEEMGLNELQTLLRDAAKRQDFMEAGKYSDMLLMRLIGDDGPLPEEELRKRRFRMSWQGLGTAPWLEDRLDALNYTFPTTIQINAMEAVNAILDVPDDVIATTTLEERIGMGNKDLGIVVSGNTGSGKTLAYLAPMLSTLSDSFFVRQRLRVGAEERILGDKTEDFVARVMAVTSPEVRSSSQKTRQGGIATGAALSSLGKSGSDVTKPLVLIVVPTKELGVQIAVMLYQLVGGTVQKNAEVFTGKASMFQYKGPKGVKIGCVLDEEDAQEGLKLQTDIAITTPDFLTKLLTDGDVVPSNLRVIAYDEADLALEQTNPDDLESLFNDDEEERVYTRLTFLVGASVTESLGNLAVRSRVLPEGKSYIATSTNFSPLSSSMADDPSKLASEESTVAALTDLDICLDPGLQHGKILTGDKTRLLTLTKALRQELKRYDDAVLKAEDPDQIQRPRVVVFFPTEEEAREAIGPIRDSMWNEHKVCVLLPKTGFDPMRIMEEFTDGKTNLMIATPNSVRGLDFPSLTHVYTMYLPFEDPREYIHLAGRVGRVGQKGSKSGVGGRVAAIVKEDEVEKMNQLAKTLGFNISDIELEEEEGFDINLDEDNDDDDDAIDLDIEDVDEDRMKLERMRRYLEDTLTLVDSPDDPQPIVDVESSTDTAADDEDEDEGSDKDIYGSTSFE